LDEDSKNRWQKSIAVGELRTDQLEYARADFAAAQIRETEGEKIKLETKEAN
jgi:soluble P-type ATPase